MSDPLSTGTGLPPLVTPDWLQAHLHRADVRVVDATWFLPTDARDARRSYEQEHLPGAVFFDVDRIAAADTDLPHMLPDAETFAAAVGALGIGDGDHVICYDAHGIYSAPRVWWTFRVFGHDAVSVLDGGLPRWRDEGRPLARVTEHPQPRPFAARFDPSRVVDAAAILANLAAPSFQLVDVRPEGRFRGDAPEPRPGLRSGHVPGSRSVPWSDLLTADGRSLRPPHAIRALAERAGVDPDGPLVATCGSGLTAALLVFALHVAGASVPRLYDGSWAEWGALPDTPVATGPA